MFKKKFSWNLYMRRTIFYVFNVCTEACFYGFYYKIYAFDN